MEVTSEIIAALTGHARRAGAHECCGLLLGNPGDHGRIVAVVPTANVHPDTAHCFEIDPAALIDAYRTQRQGGAMLLGFYHSHPGGGCAPSVTDRAQAGGDGRIWAIVAGDVVGFWRDTAAGFVPIVACEGA